MNDKDINNKKNNDVDNNNEENKSDNIKNNKNNSRSNRNHKKSKKDDENNNKDSDKDKNDKKRQEENGSSQSAKVQKLLQQFLSGDLSGDIKNSISNIINNEVSEEATVDDPYSAELTRIRVNLTDINVIREELAKLDINLTERVYYDFEVFPLLNSLFFLSNAAENYSSAARNLAQVNFSKSSEIKQAINLTDESNDVSEKVLKALEQKIDILIKIGRKRRKI
jgi:hypothetical protein